MTKTNTRNRIVSILLVLVMLLSLLPTTALAATYPGSVRVYNASGAITSLDDGECLVTNNGSATSYAGGTSYVARYDSGTLYLKDYHGVAADGQIYADGDLNIVVENDSSFTTSVSTTNNLYGIQAGGKLNISGSGKLTVTANGNGDVYGIYAKEGVTISAPLVVNVGKVDSSKNGSLYGIYTKSGAISLSGNDMTVTATGGTSTVYGVYNAADTSTAITNNGNIGISGTLTVNLSSGYINRGISSQGGDITLESATVKIPGSYRYGIFNRNGNVVIKNTSDVDISSDISGNNGICTYDGGDLNIKNSTVSISAKGCAADLQNGKLFIKDSIVDLTMDAETYRVVETHNSAANEIDLSGSGTVTLTALGEQTGSMIAGKVTATPGTKLEKGTYYDSYQNYDGEYDGSSKTVLKFVHEVPAPATYTVSFNANGGTGTMADVTDVSGEYTLPANGFTAPDGKQFKGWATSAYGSVISGTTYEVSSDTTFYAIWESKEYSIIVTDGKATIGAGSEISKAAEGTAVTLTANAAPSGKVFDKWEVVSGGITLADANSATTTFTMPASAVSVKATYKTTPVTTYNLTTQVNGGHGTISASKTGLTAGSTETITFNPEVGYEIDTVTVNGTATSVSGNTLNVTMNENKTVVVTYKAIEYNITVTDGKATIGAGSEISKAAEGTAVTLTANAAPSGKVFDKWEVVSGGITIADANSATTTFTMPAEAVSVKATYKNAPHTHTYNQETVKPEALKTPADCTSNAVYFKSCSCGAISTTDAFVAMNTALGHAYGSDWKYDSTNHWHECSRCHDKKDEAAHDYGSDNVCDTCGYYKTVPHTHNLTLVAAKAATCTEGGKEAYYKCEGCGKFYEDVLGTKEITDLASWGNIAKIAHTTKQTVTKATPTANGKIVNYCSVCKKTLSTTVIPKASSIKLKATSLTYNGKVRTPKVIVKDRTGKTLVKNTDYTVSYAKGRKYVGKYAVKITFKGKYSGTKTLYFTIKPKATSISSLKAGSKKFTVKWKKQATQTTGYQVQYSASSKFSKAKTVTVGKNTTVSKKISKLSGKKKYYVRVRTYKTVKINGKSIRIYSGWSKAKTVTTKK